MKISQPEIESFTRQVFYEVAAHNLGVWEVLWAANSRFPSASVSDRVEVAQRVVRGLTSCGVVKLYPGEKWPSHEVDSKPVKDVEKVLRDRSSWSVEGDLYWLCKTASLLL
ncbi:MAG TPA: hypothetical protein VEJ87_00635 [Acidimicrobiales bacterium]|nr:hypothetical protein [Acidimicrobiales bacterium]